MITATFTASRTPADTTYWYMWYGYTIGEIVSTSLSIEIQNKYVVERISSNKIWIGALAYYANGEPAAGFGQWWGEFDIEDGGIYELDFEVGTVVQTGSDGQKEGHLSPNVSIWAIAAIAIGSILVLGRRK